MSSTFFCFVYNLRIARGYKYKGIVGLVPLPYGLPNLPSNHRVATQHSILNRSRSQSLNNKAKLDIPKHVLAPTSIEAVSFSSFESDPLLSPRNWDQLAGRVT